MNCSGNTYNIGMGCCQPVLAPIENYYTKYQIDRMIESATTSGCCITPEEVDDKITSAKTEIENEIPSLSGYATQQWVENKGYLTEHQELKTINNQSLVGSGNIVIEGGSGTSITVDGEISSASTNPVENRVIYNALQNKADVNILNNYLLKSKIWCGDNTEWARISGSTDPDVLYLIHD